MLWLIAAILSAFFAGVTAILSKYGVKNTNSNLATALRTSVVLIFAWLIVFISGDIYSIKNAGVKSIIFLILSGIATGASWLCYFKALSLGDTSKVAAVDKSSIIISVLLALCIFESERNLWYIKLILLAMIGIGTYLMIDINLKNASKNKAWLIFASLSAIFAALTSILAKIGIANISSNSATALRTCVVFIFAWLIAVFKKDTKGLKTLNKKDLTFIILSGIATGASWLFYYYAIGHGNISAVVPIDKLSILVTVIFSAVCFKEKISKKAVLGLSLMVVATVFMAFI